MVRTRSRVQISSGACQEISLDAFKIKVLGETHSKSYYKSLDKLAVFFSKNIYNNPQELLEEYKKNIDLINSRWSHLKLIKRLFNYLKEQNVSEDVLIPYRKLLKKSKKDKIDNFVPTDEEVLDTLIKLRPKLRPLYLMYLYSGIRVLEGQYLLENIDKLKTQYVNNYQKVYLDYNRHTKSAYFCYTPLTIFNQIKTLKTPDFREILRVIKKNKLVSIKYCRKWFFTKCIELGIPESIADFYEGRVANSVGSNHYLSRQSLADNNYYKILGHFDNFYNKLKEVENNVK